MKTECKICNKEVKDLKGLSVHLSKIHKMNKDDLKNYYDEYIKKENDGKCYFCNNEAIFKSITKGYHKICNSKECLGKTRATGTYQFLMYKYNLSEKDAIDLMNKRAEDRGEKIKNGLQKEFEKNKNFFKEKSRQCVEFWLKKGYSQEDAEIEVKKSFDDIHTKTWKKRRENPELYKDVNTAQIGYWLKKGYSQKEAEIKLSQRQKTFSLQICIDKYGKKKGREIWLNRQIKWIENYKKNNFSKISQELFWILFDYEIVKNNEVYFATLLNGQKDESGKNNEYRLKLDTCAVIPDFFVKNQNKIIDFDGEYYHRKGSPNEQRKVERDAAIIRNGYKILHIKEKDFRTNKQATIQRCIDFINN